MPMVKGSTACVVGAATGEIFYNCCGVAMSKAVAFSPCQYLDVVLTRVERCSLIR